MKKLMLLLVILSFMPYKTYASRAHFNVELQLSKSKFLVVESGEDGTDIDIKVFSDSTKKDIIHTTSFKLKNKIFKDTEYAQVFLTKDNGQVILVFIAFDRTYGNFIGLIKLDEDGNVIPNYGAANGKKSSLIEDNRISGFSIDSVTIEKEVVSIEGHRFGDRSKTVLISFNRKDGSPIAITS